MKYCSICAVDRKGWIYYTIIVNDGITEAIISNFIGALCIF